MHAYSTYIGDGMMLLFFLLYFLCYESKYLYNSPTSSQVAQTLNIPTFMLASLDEKIESMWNWKIGDKQ